MIKRSEGIWLLSKTEVKDEAAQELADFLWDNSESQGLRILSGKRFPYKVTASFFQVFSRNIKKGTIDLSERESLDILKRKTVEEGYEDLPPGYYFCLFESRFIGVALKMKEGLVSQVPKSLTGQLSKNLKLSNE